MGADVPVPSFPAQEKKSAGLDCAYVNMLRRHRDREEDSLAAVDVNALPEVFLPVRGELVHQL